MKTGLTSSIRKKSGRYNVTDTSLVSPQYRWPNEGLVVTSHFKKPAYDELNMAQWISVQLNNILLVEENTTLRNILTQVSMAMRDAVSLPWPMVRSAWVVSMMDIEEGRISWNDSMQWSLNRIGNSQLAVLNSNSVSQNGQKFKVCKFYNEGSCANENHHGIYKHYYAYCHKQGRSLMHPECRCRSRTSGRSQDHKAATSKEDPGQTPDPPLTEANSYDFQQPVNTENFEHINLNSKIQISENSNDHAHVYNHGSFHKKYDICRVNNRDYKHEYCCGGGVK